MEDTKLAVLIVDDEKVNLQILSDLIKDEVDVYVAKNGIQAIKKVHKLKPDLILLDIVMPEMNGFEVIQQLKEEAETRDIPVIVITGLSNVGDEEKAFDCGASDYIQKPFNAAVVKARVNIHLQLIRQRLMMEKLANIDPLTLLANRRKFNEVFAQELRVAKRESSPLTVLMIDVDHFKQYNDNYDHMAGDEVLEAIGGALAKNFQRPRDFVARYGGEEFVVILPGTHGNGAVDKMESCCKAIIDLNITHDHASELNIVTISLGGVTCIPEHDMRSVDLLKIADEMLYQAKDRGRNQVVWSNLL